MVQVIHSGVVAWFSCIILSNAAAFAAVATPAHLYHLYGNASAGATTEEGVARDSRLEDTMSSLAEQACLFALPNSTEPELEQCRFNFLVPPPDNEDGVSDAWRPCRGENTITVPGREDVRGGKFRVTIAEDTTNITRDLFISIQRSNESTLFNSISSNATYNLWVLTFDSSGRRFGAQEYVLQPRLEPLPVHAFNPPTQFQFQDDGLMADMSWNMTEDYNCDYFAYYTCGETQPFDPPIYTMAGYPQSLSAHYLPFSSTCRVTIVSSLGASEVEAVFNFTTPSCQRVRGAALCLPERPSAVRAEAKASDTLTASGEHQYTVWVQWAAPENPPQSYTVVVQSVTGNYTASVQVDGNATEAVLENAELSGYYHVQVTAASQTGKTKSKVVEELALPPKERRWMREAAWATAACSVAALLMVMVLWWWRRVRVQHRLRRHRYFQELEQNAPKELSLGSDLVYSTDAFELRSDRVILFDVLGEGAFGVVRKGWIADKSKEVAVKMLKDSPTAEDVRQFRQEMEVMKSVGAHAHVVSLLGCVTTAHNMMIVVEYCARGDLLNYLRCAWEAIAAKRLKVINQEKNLVDHDNYIAKNAPDVTLHNLAVNKLYDLQAVSDSDLSAVDLLSFCRQIAMGMEFLSSNKVVHRDLAARNILVCADKTVKIADFGLSRDVYRDNQYRKTTNGKLPIKWMALESLTHQIYTTQSDVWSFGIVVWETVTLGGVPYPGLSAAELPSRLRDGYRMPRPYNCAPKLYELMSSCWHEVPLKRPTFVDLHEQLDSLLSEASPQDYLEVEGSEDRKDAAEHKVPPDKFFKYWKFIYRDGKSTSESSGGVTFYEKHIYPLKQAQSHHALLNHYSGTPTHYAPSACSVTAD